MSQINGEENSEAPGPSNRLTAQQFKSEITYRSVKLELDLESVVSKSLTNLKLPRVVDATKTQSQIALTSLLKVIETKALTAAEKVKDNQSTAQIIHQLDVLDYFAAKDGLKYIGFLEQLQYSYDIKCKAILYDKDDQVRDEAEEAKRKIELMSEYHYVPQDKELHEYDFPVIAEKIMHHFPIDASRKLHEIAKYHNYGIKMILHWVYVIQRQTKVLNPMLIEDFTIELLAEMMVPSFAIFIHFAEFIISMSDAPTALKDAYPLDDFIGYIRRFYEALATECSAIAESVGEIMVRIPGIERQFVVEKMTKIYYAVNHCNYTTSKVLDALIPMLLYYQIQVIIGTTGTAKDHKRSHDRDFKRFSTGGVRRLSVVNRTPTGRRNSTFGNRRFSTGY